MRQWFVLPIQAAVRGLLVRSQLAALPPRSAMRAIVYFRTAFGRTNEVCIFDRAKRRPMSLDELRARCGTRLKKPKSARQARARKARNTAASGTTSGTIILDAERHGGVGLYKIRGGDGISARLLRKRVGPFVARRLLQDAGIFATGWDTLSSSDPETDADTDSETEHDLHAEEMRARLNTAVAARRGAAA